MTILDPNEHRDAVLAFDEYYSIGQVKPSLRHLETIIASFTNLPYENISKVIRYREYFEDAVRMRLPMEVVHTHIEHRLGGTCFSLTFLLQTILTRHDFDCYPVMADMRWGNDVHCAMIVRIDSRLYLIDPGYLLTKPMEIASDHPRLYRTPHSGVELVFNSEVEAFDLYTFDKTEIKWRYRFQNKPVPPESFMKHWMASFRWNSMHGLCLTRVENQRLVYIHKTYYRETTFEGKRNMNIKNRVHQTVEDVFGIDRVWVEQALAAIEENMAKERELGLWLPKSERGGQG